MKGCEHVFVPVQRRIGRDRIWLQCSECGRVYWDGVRAGSSTFSRFLTLYEAMYGPHPARKEHSR